MATEYDEKIEEEIPGMVYAISVHDTEENDYMPPIVSHVDEYELPEHTVREREVGGGSTSYALLKVLESLKSSSGRKKKMTWADALQAMHEAIEDPEDETRQAVPTLSTSRPINVRDENLRLVNTSKQGVKRALLVGAHYLDEEDESTWLASCHTDVRRIRQHLIHEEGFEKSDILVMMDDDRHHEPTKGLILDALERMCQISEAGDTIFFHFSGHGGTLINQEEYDEDGITHELLVPGDYRDKGVGVLLDDELYASFVTKVPEGVYAVAIIDTCHPPSYQSGKTSAIDLPYVCDAGYDEVRSSEGYRPGRMLLGAGAIAGAAAVGSKAKKKKKSKKKKHEEEDEEMNDPSNHDDSYEEENSKSRRKSKSKKKKPEGEEEEIYDSYEERPDESERQKSKKKSKHKKKKKEESSRNEEEYPEVQEEEKPKKKKKKPKKKSVD